MVFETPIDTQIHELESKKRDDELKLAFLNNPKVKKPSSDSQRVDNLRQQLIDQLLADDHGLEAAQQKRLENIIDVCIKNNDTNQLYSELNRIAQEKSLLEHSKTRLPEKVFEQQLSRVEKQHTQVETAITIVQQALDFQTQNKSPPPSQSPKT